MNKNTNSLHNFFVDAKKKDKQDMLSLIQSVMKTEAFEEDDLIGKQVKNINTGAIGTIVESSVGYSVSGVNQKGHWQTLGTSKEELLNDWFILDDAESDLLKKGWL